MRRLGALLSLCIMLGMQFLFLIPIEAYGKDLDRSLPNDGVLSSEDQILAKEPSPDIFEPKTKLPYEIMVAHYGKWIYDYWVPRKMFYGYEGNYIDLEESQAYSFTLTKRSRIKVISINTVGHASLSDLVLVDQHGNIYGGFDLQSEDMNNLKAFSLVNHTITEDQDQALDEMDYTIHSYTPRGELILPPGQYKMHYETKGALNPVNPFFIKGYSESAYQRYEKDLSRERLAWEQEQAKKRIEMNKAQEQDQDMLGLSKDDIYKVFGDESLIQLLQDFQKGDSPDYEPIKDSSPDTVYLPSFDLDVDSTLEQVILETYNQGEGAKPTKVLIYNDDRSYVHEMDMFGASLNDTANGMWVNYPLVDLKKGRYYIEPQDLSVLTYDSDGQAVFSVKTSPLKAPLADFTGSYRLDLKVVKTSNIMGPVTADKPSFELNKHLLSVVDLGQVVEIIGEYKGMKFSQQAQVIEREENRLQAHFDFHANLENLPYNANIGADVLLEFTKNDEGKVSVDILGSGTYVRQQSALKGMDNNTYSISGQALRVNESLPLFIVSALERTYGAGFVPGPDTPIEVVVGALFPALVGLVVTVIQNMILKAHPEYIGMNSDHLSVGEKAMKEANDSLMRSLNNDGLSVGEKAMKDANESLRQGLNDDGLSVGEKAMKEANNSLGQGLVSEKEKEAWGMMAEALAASGGDLEDAISVGDNELPGGDDYVAPKESYNDTYDGDMDHSDSTYEDDDYGDDGYDGDKDKSDSAYEDEDSNSDEGYDDSLDQDSQVTKEESDYEPIDEDASLSDKAISDEGEEEAITKVIETNSKGSTKLVQYDPETGEWFDPETDNIIDLDKHQEFLDNEKARLDDYHKRNEFLNDNKLTAMDDIMREIKDKYKNIEKTRIRREMLSERQKVLENSMKETNEDMKDWGQIFNGTKANILKDFVELDEDIGKGYDYIKNGATGIKNDIVKDPIILWHTFTGSVSTVTDFSKKVIVKGYEASTNPVATLKKGYKLGKKVGKIVKKSLIAVKETVSDPIKLAKWSYENLGVKEFIKSQDMNARLSERIGNVLLGTAKIGMTADTLMDGVGIVRGAGSLAKGSLEAVKNAGGVSAFTKKIVKEGGESFTNNVSRMKKGISGKFDDLLGVSNRKATTKTASRGTRKVGGDLIEETAELTTSKSTLKASDDVEHLVFEKGRVPKKVKTSNQRKYIKSNDPPNIEGMTEKSMNGLKRTSKEYDAKILSRPTNKYSGPQIKKGMASPKPMEIKAKTVDEIDRLIGGPGEGKEGLVAYFEPKLPTPSKMKTYSKEMQEKIVEKYHKRMNEFVDLEDDMLKLKSKGIEVENGLIVNTKVDDGAKYFAGDNDIYDIIKADGSPMPDAEKRKIIGEMIENGDANVLHEDLISWYRKTDGSVKYSAKAKAGMVYDASEYGGEGLVMINPDGSVEKVFQDQMENLKSDEEMLHFLHNYNEGLVEKAGGIEVGVEVIGGGGK